MEIAAGATIEEAFSKLKKLVGSRTVTAIAVYRDVCWYIVAGVK